MRGDCIAPPTVVQVRLSPYTTGVFHNLFDPESPERPPGADLGDSCLHEYCDGSRRRYVGVDLQGTHLRWVRFTGATFVDCSFRDSTWECVLGDFAVFENCDFHETHLMESVFAGSRMTNCRFVGATADICNFNGIVARECDFSDASLRRSRFINARLSDVKFVNCDLKDALFHYSIRKDVSFRHSNDEEACF